MSLTNILLFLILVTLATYLFTPWKNMQKPTTIVILLQWLMWLVIFTAIIFIATSTGLVIFG
jgi:hypothetical protein|tara:strand:- start:26 stop:211 length:186 start_codon:yes stop_codon:yes gene_type:complete